MNKCIYLHIVLLTTYILRYWRTFPMFLPCNKSYENIKKRCGYFIDIVKLRDDSGERKKNWKSMENRWNHLRTLSKLSFLTYSDRVQQLSENKFQRKIAEISEITKKNNHPWKLKRTPKLYWQSVYSQNFLFQNSSLSIFN